MHFFSKSTIRSLIYQPVKNITFARSASSWQTSRNQKSLFAGSKLSTDLRTMDPISGTDPKSVEFSALSVGKLSPITYASLANSKYRSPYATNFPRSQPVPSAPLVRRPYERTIKMRRLMFPTAKGRVAKYNAWCLVGDRSGSVGYAQATSSQAARAMKRALQAARRSMRSFELKDGRTLYHDIDVQYGPLRMRLMTKQPGYSVRAQRNVSDFCNALGIQDLAVKIQAGSTNPITIIKALFYAMENLHKTPSQVAEARGLPVRELKR